MLYKDYNMQIRLFQLQFNIPTFGFRPPPTRSFDLTNELCLRPCAVKCRALSIYRSFFMCTYPDVVFPPAFQLERNVLE